MILYYANENNFLMNSAIFFTGAKKNKCSIPYFFNNTHSSIANGFGDADSETGLGLGLQAGASAQGFLFFLIFEIINFREGPGLGLGLK